MNSIIVSLERCRVIPQSELYVSAVSLLLCFSFLSLNILTSLICHQHLNRYTSSLLIFIPALTLTLTDIWQWETQQPHMKPVSPLSLKLVTWELPGLNGKHLTNLASGTKAHGSIDPLLLMFQLLWRSGKTLGLCEKQQHNSLKLWQEGKKNKRVGCSVNLSCVTMKRNKK